jgi:hypothetical protein
MSTLSEEDATLLEALVELASQNLFNLRSPGMSFVK